MLKLIVENFSVIIMQVRIPHKHTGGNQIDEYSL